MTMSEAQMPSKPVISIVDDDPSVRAGMADLLTSMGLTAEAFPSAADFLRSDRLHDTSCLIADVQLPEMTGLALYDHMAGAGNDVPTILITAFPDDKDRARALRSGVFYYLSKPFDDNELLACIQRALDHRRARRREGA
jgi:FixJ family two-component response regulator